VNRLRWFGHVMSKGSKTVGTVMKLSVKGRRGRQKWLNVIECDMRITGVCINDVENWVK